MDQPLKPKTFTNVISCAYYVVCNILMGFPPFTPRTRKNDPMKGGLLAWDHTHGHVDRWWCMYLILKNMEGFMQHKCYKHGCLLSKEVGGEDGISFSFVYYFVLATVYVQTSWRWYPLIFRDFEVNDYIKFVLLELIIFRKQTKILAN